MKNFKFKAQIFVFFIAAFFAAPLINGLLASAAWGEDFITQKEYAKMLYENPRGISCKHCHGERGGEQVLEHYTQRGVRKAFVVPNIQSVGFAEFERALSAPREARSIMPTYSLTKQEIQTLFAYIQDFKKDKE